MAAKKKNSSVDLAPQPDPRAPLDGALLLSKAQGLLAELEADLLARARGSAPVREALRARHDAERAARRTADPLEVWERHFVTQVAASWLLSCAFVRTLEDRGLLGHNRIAGPGALDSQRLFFELAPSLTEREYLLTIFRELSRLPAARDLFDARHNPVWMLGPSAEMAKKLVALFRTPNADTPGLRFGQADTRFLGDLYQDLSADVRERFALLQTPHFVEKYILDRTLERAVARFGLDETTLIDPTCGSGHFLLGAFERLVDHRLRKEPGLDVREAARKALDAVYGADINPYAVAIARFRLTLAFLERAGYARLADAPALPLHLVVGDSLLHAPQQAHLGDIAGTTKAAWGGEEFALEDDAAAKNVLLRRYAAVVGNPPYITVKDAVLRERYREMYPRSAAGKYSLGAPFTERFFLLAKSAGFVGMITANSFMKREFGRKLIEQFLPTANLDGVVNTSGAYIPGHGTPTVLLFGTNEPKQGDDVLTVLAKRGEPATPDDPEHGFVWRSIADHGNEVGFENDYVSVARVSRATLEKHPWSLGGGGAAELKELLEERTTRRLGEMAAHIGIAAVTGEDDVYLLPPDAVARLGIERTRPMLIGEEIRDWATSSSQACLFPYGDDLRLEPIERFPSMVRVLWPVRSNISKRKRFGTPMLERGLSWYELQELYTEKLRSPLSITFAEVATHNHFVLNRGGKVFKQTAPIIKLKDGATEEDHLTLLAYLNSSTVCFWMKQVCFPKATSNKDVGHIRGKEESNRFAFSATALSPMPVPSFDTETRATLAGLALDLSGLAQQRAELTGQVAVERVAAGEAATEVASDVARRRAALLERMKVLQEDIDWCVYSALGLTAEFTSSPADVTAPVRPFEGARLGLAVSASWHRRAEISATNPNIQMIETPVFKRPWDGRRGIFGHGVMSLDEEIRNATLDWLGQEAERLVSADASTRKRAEVARVMEGGERSRRVIENADEGIRSVGAALDRGAVPFLAAHRHTESGLEKRAEWERVWDLQRAEDRGEKVPPFDPPPKYDQKDYRDATTWRLRGKLDVPKERFISYPGCESDEDKEPVYGWAGWNHLQQALALAKLYMNRKDEGWTKDRLAPMLAGLLELVPWVKQWHNDDDPDYGGRRGDYFESFLDNECHALGLTREDLRAWRPGEKAKGKKAEAKKTAGEPVESEDGEPRPAPKPRARKKKAATEATDT